MYVTVLVSFTDSELDLHKQVSNNQWLESAQDDDASSITTLKEYRGVVLQRDDGNYVAYPSNLNEHVIRAVLRLNVPVAFTMSSEVTASLIRQLEPNQTMVGDPRSGNISMPIIDSMESLASGQAQVPRDNFICLCRKEHVVLVWGDTVSSEYKASRRFNANIVVCIGTIHTCSRRGCRDMAGRGCMGRSNATIRNASRIRQSEPFWHQSITASAQSLSSRHKHIQWHGVHTPIQQELGCYPNRHCRGRGG